MTESSHLSIKPQREIVRGFETYVFEVSKNYLAATAARMAKTLEQSVFNQAFLDLYPYPRRPCLKELSHIQVEESKGREHMVQVTLVLKRGHWIVAEFLETHASHVHSVDSPIWASLQEKDYRMVCMPCDVTVILPIESFP